MAFLVCVKHYTSFLPIVGILPLCYRCGSWCSETFCNLSNLVTQLLSVHASAELYSAPPKLVFFLVCPTVYKVSMIVFSTSWGSVNGSLADNTLNDKKRTASYYAIIWVVLSPLYTSSQLNYIATSRSYPKRKISLEIWEMLKFWSRTMWWP